MLEIEDAPELPGALLGVALSGWVDAGSAGAGAADALVALLEGPRLLARVDLGEWCDLQQTRPTAALVAGRTRAVSWPAIEVVAGELGGRAVVVCRGPEPSLGWQVLGDELAAFARRLGVVRGATLGGMPSVVSHRRPIRVLVSATEAGLLDREGGSVRPDYEGATGAQTVVQVCLGAAGIPTLGLWAQVPHYVAGAAAPPAVAALLSRFAAFGHLDLSVDDELEQWQARIEDGLAERPDVAELVDALDGLDASDADLPSGDDLAAEIERFLRDE